MFLQLGVWFQLALTFSSESNQVCNLPDVATCASKRQQDIQFIQFKRQRARYRQPSLLEDDETELDGFASAADGGDAWVDLPWAGLREKIDETGNLADIEESQLDGNFLLSGDEELPTNQQMVGLLANSQEVTDAVEQVLARDVTMDDEDTCSFTTATPSCQHMVMHNCTNASSLSKFCPDACSYVVVDPLFSCQAACVKPQQCHLGGLGTSFDNPVSHVCEAGSIEGCEVYGPHTGKTETLTCKRCSAFFSQAGSECDFLPGYRKAVKIALVCIGLVVVIMVPLNLYRWCALPIGNPSALKSGWKQYEMFLVSMNDFNHPDEKTEFFPLSTTDMRTENITGPGLCLFYNSLVFLLAMAVLVASTITFLYLMTDYYESGIEGSAACHIPELQTVAKTLKTTQQMYAYAIGGLWLLLLLCSLYYAREQHRAHRELDKETSLMSDFASRAWGFPPDADEDEIKRYFDQISPGAAFAVSLAYDYREHEKTVKELLSNQLAEQQVKQGYVRVPQEMQSPVNKVNQEEVRQMLRSLKGTGVAFPVSSTEQNRHNLHHAFNHSDSIPLFRGRWRIQMTHIKEEPTTFFWANFNFDRQTHRVYGVLETFIVLLETAVLAVVFGLPAAYFLYYWSKANGVGTESLSTTVVTAGVGFLITLMNLLLYVLVDVSVQRVGFYYKVDIDRCNLVGATVIVGCTTFFSLTMALVAVQSANHGVDRGLLEGLTEQQKQIREESVDMAESAKLFALLVPGILLLPDLVGRFVKYVLSAKAMYNYWISLPIPGIYEKWDLRSQKNLTVKEAQDSLLPHDMQIQSDYANSICVFGTVFVMIGLSGYIPLVTCWILVAWVIMTYVSLKICHLRFNAFTEYTSCLLDDCATLLWGIPVSMLAAISLHWAQQGWRLHLGWWSVFLAFVVAYILYCVLVNYVLDNVDPFDHSSSDDYVTSVRRLSYDYFNTNPIHVLKSVYLKDRGPPLIYFQRGKEHLQKQSKEPARLELYETDHKSCFPDDFKLCC